jgi:hypothetical protein
MIQSPYFVFPNQFCLEAWCYALLGKGRSTLWTSLPFLFLLFPPFLLPWCQGSMYSLAHARHVLHMLGKGSTYQWFYLPHIRWSWSEHSQPSPQPWIFWGCVPFLGAALGFELRASRLTSGLTTWATPPVFFVMGFFEIPSQELFAQS